jgi:hypothetical protein
LALVIKMLYTEKRFTGYMSLKKKWANSSGKECW